MYLTLDLLIKLKTLTLIKLLKKLKLVIQAYNNLKKDLILI
jgi:hypothetical protein